MTGFYAAVDRAAWKIAEGQDKWSLVVINPAFVIGPSASIYSFGFVNFINLPDGPSSNTQMAPSWPFRPLSLF